MKTELKPCPFCGSKAVVQRMYDGNPYVCCVGDCPVVLDGETEQEAIEAWNTRAERTTRFELLATEVDKNGDALAVGVHCALCGLLDEEAVGADPDNWMLWRYCPNCGAKVVKQ